ncbi:MAG: VCBS repeat-containing protein [Kofleriaceae bacterium]
MRLVLSLLLLGCGEVKGSLPDGPPGGNDEGTGVPACGDGIRQPGEVCYKAPFTIQATDAAYDAQFADMDSDGDLDVVFLISDQVQTHINASGVFAASAIAGATAFGPYMLAQDFDNDQNVDLAVAGLNVAGGSGVTMYKGDGTAHQTMAGSGSLGVTAAAIGRGDVKGKGTMLVTFDLRTVQLWAFETGLGIIEDGGAQVSNVVTGAVGKLDGDNFADIAVGRSNGIVVFRGGTSGLSPIISTPMVERTGALAIGDVTGDGIADIAYTQVDPSTDTSLVAMMPGAGAAAFLAPITIPAKGISMALQLADVDGDGKQDLVTGTGDTSWQLDVSLGTATGFAAPVALPISGPANQIHTGDYNKDEAPDLIVTNTGTQTITIFESNP